MKRYSQYVFLFIIIFFGCITCGILVSWPRTEPMPPALESWSLNHWTTKEVLFSKLHKSTYFCVVGVHSSLQTGECLAAAAKLLQSCPTLCDPIDSSPSGSSVPEILQARVLEGVAIVFSNAQKWKVKVKALSRVWLFETPWTVAYQAPPSMGFSRQEYWSGVPLPSPGNV